MFSFSHPHWLWLLLPAAGWIVWLARTSGVQLAPRRRRFATGMRLLIVTALLCALAGMQWRRPMEGMNVFFALDRSDSVPAGQQEQALHWLNQVVKDKPATDRAGAVVFAADAAIEAVPAVALTLPAVQAVIPTERTDVGSAIRLATAAFPETGQRRIVLLSDGQENLDDALQAAVPAKAAGVSIDVVPLGGKRDNAVTLQRLELPAVLARGQTFDVKLFVQAAQAGPARLHFYRDDRHLGDSTVELEAGKNLFTFSETLTEPGFYNYDVRIEAAGDRLPQDNRALGFVWVRGQPRVLLISSAPSEDRHLAAALQAAGLEVRPASLQGFPESLAELNSYDSVILCNVAAGDLGAKQLAQLETAVRDFGVGLVCVGGPDTYAAGAYRGTALETILPVDMDLSSKKVLPPGALVLVIDRSGSMMGDKIELARRAAMGAVKALSDHDYVGVIAFDGSPHVIVDLQPAKNRRQIMDDISRLEARGGTSMYEPMVRAYEMLRSVKAALKHCVILTDGVSQDGDFAGISQKMAAERMTISTVGLGEDLNDVLLQQIASVGRGRFYAIPQPTSLPQIFIKETAIVLKSAINEAPFKPRLTGTTEPVRGIAADAYPQLLGYVATEAKPRAEVPLRTDKGDPLLAHWQCGLGRTVAFTSDARSQWAQPWLAWPQYQQFWRQVTQWSLRRLGHAEFTAAARIEANTGHIVVEALDARGDFQNFLTFQATIVPPSGGRQTVTLSQTGPGRYEGDFTATESGAYLANVLQMENGRPVGQQITGTSLAYSPELGADGTNLWLLQRLADLTGGRVLAPTGPGSNPFAHDRIRTFQAQELWEWLLRFIILAFVLEVGVRRVQPDRAEFQRLVRKLLGWIPFWPHPRPVMETVPSLAALLSRRKEVRGQRFDLTAPPGQPPATTIVVTPPPLSAPPETEAQSAPVEEVRTTSQLLAAKRRVQRRPPAN
ncbi:MAG TPA: VWA domain-containing protein [Verrucomicrobiota bacterium]|nr:VWA domain-containing protein [Verrucomicrobiota bacterium]HNT16063.1 VWA domain-containing protein [Verrucomicrobiota bacterium]